MIEFIDYMALACLIGAAIGFTFLVMVGIFKLIDYLTKDKSKDAIVNFFEEENDE